MQRLVIFCSLVACNADVTPRDLVPQGGGNGKADGQCAYVPAAIAPTGAPPYSCGPLDAIDAPLAADVNAFWSSQVVACACGPDFPQGCVGAFSLNFYGYIYVGVDFMDRLAASGSVMPAQYVFAHEMGHEVVGHCGQVSSSLQLRELTADCLGGYYLGSLVCRGLASENDITATLRTACILADGTGDPIADQKTHGTCAQRETAVVTGMRAYLTGQRPLEACAL